MSTNLPIFERGARVSVQGRPALILTSNEALPDWDVPAGDVVTVEFQDSLKPRYMTVYAVNVETAGCPAHGADCTDWAEIQAMPMEASA